MRTVTVRYIVPVFATVDIDAKPGADDMFPDDAILQVQQGDSDICRIDNPAGVAALTGGDVISQSYSEGAVDPSTLTEQERERALEIAEGTIWPAWEGY